VCVQMTTEGNEAPIPEKFSAKRIFNVWILNTCYEICAPITEGKQRKYDAASEILKRKRGL
jgi:hypothetical protein